MSGVPSILAPLLPLLTLALVYVLVVAPAAGRLPWVTRLCLASGGALLALALGVGLDASAISDALSAVLAGVGLSLLAWHRERVEDRRRAREDALRQNLEETSRRAVRLGGRQVELEAERARLLARAASLEEENAKLRSTLAENERRFRALDWRLRHERTLDALERRNQELGDLARHDALTHLYNRRHVDRVLDALANRSDVEEIAVALFDVDHFKTVNDRYGHPIGDRVLSDIAYLFRRQLRQGDVVGRYGGEEFIVILSRAASAPTVCEKLREAIATHPWSEIAGGLRVTISAGVATARRPFDPQRLVAEADRLLYQAKETGRNRVAVVGA